MPGKCFGCLVSMCVVVGVWSPQGPAVGGSIGAFLLLPLPLFAQLTQLLSFKS